MNSEQEKLLSIWLDLPNGYIQGSTTLKFSFEYGSNQTRKNWFDY